MSIQQERKRRARTIWYLERQGAVEGKDWHWGTPDQWNAPGVLDAGRTVEVQERLTPVDKTALPIMIRSSGVRLLGGLRLASMMDRGRFPSEMPFAVAPELPDPAELN